MLAKSMPTCGTLNDIQTSFYHVMGSSKKHVKVFSRRPHEAADKMEFLRKKRFIVKVQLPIGENKMPF